MSPKTSLAILDKRSLLLIADSAQCLLSTAVGGVMLRRFAIIAIVFAMGCSKTGAVIQMMPGESTPKAPPVAVGACDQLAASGMWENITPPVTPLHDITPCPYGGDLVMNPLNPATLYVGSCNEGIWKTTNCGSSWAHINTGTNGEALDAGRQWTFLIDPLNPEVLYANSGYNSYIQGGSFSGNGVSGAFKSINGGVDWQVIWPPSDQTLANVVQYNFVGHLAMDRGDSQHLLISFHAACAAPHSAACFGESRDGGATWRIVDGLLQWSGGEGQAIYFLDNGTNWLFGSQSNGLWRTSDSGAHWTDLNVAQGHAAGALYRAKDGTFYLATPEGILRSPDGSAWSLVPNSGSVMLGITGNGTTMFASRGFPWDPSAVLYEPFWTSAEGDGLNWSQLSSPMLSNGGGLAYDSAHHLLYSSNLGAGVWRVVIP
jgi:hypothetical protein